MGKIFGILMIVLGVWIGLEIFTKGSDAAFGGLFATGGRPQAVGEAPGEPRRTPIQRIGDRVQESMDAGAARSTNGVDDESADEAGDEE
jgi:hypothetical protein